MTVALQWSYPHWGAKHIFLSSKADSNMSARGGRGCLVTAQRGIGRDSDLDSGWRWSRLGPELPAEREKDTRSGRRALKALPPLLEHALNVNLGRFWMHSSSPLFVTRLTKTAKCVNKYAEVSIYVHLHDLLNLFWQGILLYMYSTVYDIESIYS